MLEANSISRNQTNEELLEKRKSQARARRYKKPMLKSINLDAIHDFIREEGAAAEEIAYLDANEDGFIDALGGDEEEAFEFRTAFSMLAADIEAFRDDLNENWIPTCFNDFFCGIGGDRGEMLGYDKVEGGYFGLDSWLVNPAQLEADKRLMRLTKQKLLDSAGQCFRVAMAFVALKSRWGDLKDSIDIVRAQNDGLLTTIKRIEDICDRADSSEWQESAAKEFEQLISILPDECWLR